MVAVIKGDIIASRKIKNPKIWLDSLKELLSKWGKTPQDWELVWGDFFQIEISNPELTLLKALQIKSLLRKIEVKEDNKNISAIDVRMAIGIGEKEYTGKRISESNGPVFIYAGEGFEKLIQAKTNLAIRTPWNEFDREINLYLKLAGIFMDKWTTSSALLMETVLLHPNATQEEIGEKLGIKQSAVSRRWHRTHIDEILEIDSVFRQKLKSLTK